MWKNKIIFFYFFIKKFMIVGMDLTYLTYIKCIVRHFYLGGGLRVGLGEPGRLYIK